MRSGGPKNIEALRAFTFATLPALDGMRAKGYTYQQIADKLGVSYATVHRACNRQGTYSAAAQGGKA